jgi:hypothetical protein
MDSYSQLLLMQQYRLNPICPGEKTLQRPNRAVCEIDSTIPYVIYIRYIKYIEAYKPI